MSLLEIRTAKKPSDFKCFADEGKRCRALTVKQCKRIGYSECPFYKTESAHNASVYYAKKRAKLLGVYGGPLR